MSDHPAPTALHYLLRMLHGLSILCPLLTGCGYTVIGASHDTVIPRIALAVPPVVNHSREPGMERRVTGALRQILVQGHTFSLMPAMQASQTLHGVIQHVQIQPISFDDRENAVQYRIEAQMQIQLVTRPAQPPLVNQEIAARAEYLVQTNSGAIRENVVAREAALQRVAQRLADQCAALLEVILR